MSDILDMEQTHEHLELVQSAQEHTDGLPIVLRLLKQEEQRTSDALDAMVHPTRESDVIFRDDMPLPRTLLDVEDPSKLG